MLLSVPLMMMVVSEAETVRRLLQPFFRVSCLRSTPFSSSYPLLTQQPRQAVFGQLQTLLSAAAAVGSFEDLSEAEQLVLINQVWVCVCVCVCVCVSWRACTWAHPGFD